MFVQQRLYPAEGYAPYLCNRNFAFVVFMGSVLVHFYLYLYFMHLFVCFCSFLIVPVCLVCSFLRFFMCVTACLCFCPLDWLPVCPCQSGFKFDSMVLSFAPLTPLQWYNEHRDRPPMSAHLGRWVGHSFRHIGVGSLNRPIGPIDFVPCNHSMGADLALGLGAQGVYAFIGARALGGWWAPNWVAMYKYIEMYENNI